MTARSLVSAHADVPVLCIRIASAGRSLIRHCCPRRPARERCFIQRDDILLVLRAERTYADVERTVLPEEIVRQIRIRNGGAVGMIHWAGDRGCERTDQL